jgi:hypothetical protein
MTVVHAGNLGMSVFAGLVRFVGLIAVCGSALCLGACAHNAAEAPALEWQINSTDGSGPSQSTFDSAAGAASSLNCGHDNPDGCYEYRGGRDPVTGLAYTQL